MQPPDYFTEVQKKASDRWAQLEADPELAGPWRQLFQQVQSPAHVLSELLQNADDAGARKAIAKVGNGKFTFEHDGEDFDAEQFGSLCRFAFSNKTTLHTVGFRGVGFKSTFSLGDLVEVATPTLSVQFHRARFTLPCWNDDAGHVTSTIICVCVGDAHRMEDLDQSLRQWATSPASLLFFRNLEQLEINGQIITKRSVGNGPVSGSEYVTLVHPDAETGVRTDHLLLIRSELEAFPPDAIAEIRRERNIAELDFPPCRVELVIGLPGTQRLFVVLPTGAVVDLPFSVDAPFVQDPARYGIKEPSLSPTNRWLLDRAGKLAALAMVGWLSRSDVLPGERGKAYTLLPSVAKPPDDLNGRTTRIAREAFLAAVKPQPVMLLCDGSLAEVGTCFCIPHPLHSVWNETQLTQLFGSGSKRLLSDAVAKEFRLRLSAHGWLQMIVPEDILAKLEGDSALVPKPATWAQLGVLWAFVCANTRRYLDDRPKSVRIVPVSGGNGLQRSRETVRLPARRDQLSEADWLFVTDRALVLDVDWIEWLTEYKQRKVAEGTREEPVTSLLTILGLERASNIDEIVAQATRRVFAEQSASLADHVRLAHILAALDARVPDDFRFATHDGTLRSLSNHIAHDPTGEIEALTPDGWADQHILHASYSCGFSACSGRQWEPWCRSKKSGLHSSVPLVGRMRLFSSRYGFGDYMKECGADAPASYPYSSGAIELEDWSFEDRLPRHWRQIEATSRDIWVRVLRGILQGPAADWNGKLVAVPYQKGRQKRPRVECSDIPADWIVTLRAKPCLPDTRGNPRHPTELLLRTPETEPFREIEPFLDAQIDTPANRPLLDALGVRSSPSSPHRVLERLQALAKAPAPLRLVVEINRLYEALDRIVSRCAPVDLDSIAGRFREDGLILCETGVWVSSGEISVFSDDESQAPAIHHAFQRLSMWPRLGVPDRPTFERSLDWIQRLATGTRIDAASFVRLQMILRREPHRVWAECGHWLSLDRTWEATDRLSYRQTMQILATWECLSPSVKRATADMRMLPESTWQQPPFSGLGDLTEVVVFRVTEVRGSAPSARKPWIIELANGLRRMRLDAGERSTRVRAVAGRLLETEWKPVSRLEATPYVKAIPAGTPVFPRVLWDSTNLYVKSNVSVARLHKELADEIARPFADRCIADAITACIERNPDYVAEYLSDQFVLEDRAEHAQPVAGPDGQERPQERERGATDAAVESPEQNFAAPDVLVDSGNDETITPEPIVPEANAPLRSPAPQKPTLIELFARQRGFQWTASTGRYTHADGRWIGKSESPFNWEEHRADGTVATRIWVTDQRLTTGIEIAAELWGLVSRAPSLSAIVIHGDDHTPSFLSGQSLLKLKDEQKIVILPSRYRIVEAPK